MHGPLLTAGEGRVRVLQVTSEPAHDDVMRGLLPLLELFDDLEQQAGGLELERRDAEVADRIRDEYAEVDLAARLHASVGSAVGLALVGTDEVRGTLVRVGVDWCLLAVATPGSAHEVLVRQGALVATRGLSDRAVPAGARSVLSRLTLASCLRRLGETGERQIMCTLDGRVRSGEITRVGADFVELWDDSGPEPGPLQLPLRSLVWVRTG